VSWRPGRCWSCSTICGPSTRPGRSCAVLFHQGAPALGAGTLRTRPGLAALRAVTAGWLSPAGQLQAATALEVPEGLETRMHELRHQLTAAARQLAGARGRAARAGGGG